MYKKFSLKSMIIGIISGVVLTYGISTASALVSGNVYFSSFPIIVNGRTYSSQSPLLNYENKTYVPLNELATLTNAQVTFANGTIYINTNYGYETNLNGVTSYSQVEVNEDSSETAYINLNKYGARNAYLTYSGSNIKLSSTQFSNSGNVTITGKSAGKSTVIIRYDNGYTEYIYVTVNESEKETEDEIEIDKGDYENVSIDLDDYDADKATISITKGSSYVSISKTTFTKDGNLKITGKKEGESTIKIKYDSGDTEYIYVTVNDDDDNDDDEMEIDIDEYDYYTVDLDDYDADKATISVTRGSAFISLSKTTFTSSGKLKIKGTKEGESTVKVKYDSGDTEYIYVTVNDGENYKYSDFEYIDELDIDEDDYDYFSIDLDDYSADKATFSIISGDDNISLNRTYLINSGKVKVTGDDNGSAIIKVKYDTGDTDYIWVDVD